MISFRATAIIVFIISLQVQRGGYREVGFKLGKKTVVGVWDAKMRPY